jgi:hypothetical protein
MHNDSMQRPSFAPLVMHSCNQSTPRNYRKKLSISAVGVKRKLRRLSTVGFIVNTLSTRRCLRANARDLETGGSIASLNLQRGSH